MNFDKFKDEHCCNIFCTYYGLQPFSAETGLKITPTSEGNSMGLGQARNLKGKGRAEPDIDDDYVSSSWNRGVAIANDSASTSAAAGGYTKGMDLSESP